jgi:hypothetical protein
MQGFLVWTGIGLGVAGLAALVTGAWLAAIAFGMFSLGALSLGAECE